MLGKKARGFLRSLHGLGQKKGRFKGRAVNVRKQ